MKKLYVFAFSALFSGISLFAQNDSDEVGAVKCASFPNRNQDHSAGGSKILVLNWGYRPNKNELPKEYASKSGKFLIHYTVEGVNKVDAIDKNMNGIPDYVDSVAYYCDYVYKVECEDLGYIEPLSDGVSGGSSAYDIYIMDTGNGMQGETFYGLTTNDPCDIYPNPSRKCPSFIWIDNNYSRKDSTIISPTKKTRSFGTFEYDALKVTLAHEFHHAVQFSYGAPINDDGFVNEMTSSFMEYRVFPDLNDYKRYISKMLSVGVQNYPFGTGSPEMGYEWCAFAKMCYLKYGDIPIKRIWELIEKTVPAYKAIDSALVESGSSLKQELYSVADWLYHTNTRSVAGEYFPESQEYPLMSFYREDNYSYPSFTESNSLLKLQLQATRVFYWVEKNFSADTLDFIVINQDVNSAIYNQSVKQDYLFTLSPIEKNCDSKLLNEKLCYSSQYNVDKTAIRIYEHSGVALIASDYPFPNPYRREDEYIAFPVERNKSINKKITLTIFDAGNVQLYSRELNQEVINSRKVIVWRDIPSDISSGVYIYKLDDGDKSEIGKFTVKR
jgi:hypothetical protein